MLPLSQGTTDFLSLAVLAVFLLWLAVSFGMMIARSLFGIADFRDMG